MGNFGQALFWTQAMAGVWMFAAATTHGPEIYDWVREQVSGPPVKTAVAAVGAVADACPTPPLPKADEHNTLVVDDFAVADDGIVAPEQYLNPRTREPFAVVRVTGDGPTRLFNPGTYYRLPEGVVFLPKALSIKTDSMPYVSAPLYTALQQLHCVAALSNGEVRVNKALLAQPRQQYWENDRGVLAYGLGTTGVHLQIVDGRSDNRTPWNQDDVNAAVQKSHLLVPQPELFRAYVKLDLAGK